MKVEAWIFGSLTIFMIIVTPIYWFITADANGVPEITGTVALIMTTLLVLMIWVYLLLVRGGWRRGLRTGRRGDRRRCRRVGLLPTTEQVAAVSLTHVRARCPGSDLWVVAHAHWLRVRLYHVDGAAVRVLPRRPRALSRRVSPLVPGMADRAHARGRGCSCAVVRGFRGGTDSNVLASDMGTVSHTGHSHCRRRL